MSTNFQDIGADTGPLQHIWIGADGSFQVRHVADLGFEFVPDTSHLGDAGTFLKAGGYVYAPDFLNHESTPLFKWDRQFDQHSQSMVATVSGMSRVVTQLQTLGDDITITQVDTYIHGQSCWRTDMIIQNDYTQGYQVILYRAANSNLHALDNGYGITRAHGAVGVTDTFPLGAAMMWMIPITADHYQEDDSATLWSRIYDGLELYDTIVTDNHDAALGLSWSLTIPAKSAVVRSCLTMIDIAGGVTPPANDAWHFRGFCYRGPNGNTQAPLGGVTLKLLAGASNPPTVVRRQTTSDAGGFWNFYEDQDYTNYMVEAVDPDGMAATGSATGDGTIVSDTRIKWLTPARGVHDGNQFFKE